MAAEGLTLLGRCFFDFKGGGHSGDIELMRRLDQDAIEPRGTRAEVLAILRRHDARA